MAAAAGDGEATAALFADIPEDVCRKFQLGKCHRGEACRWKHVVWKPQTAAGGADAAEPAAKRARAVAAPRATGSAAARMAIGGAAVALTPAAQAEALRGNIKQREAAWRAANPEHPAGEAVPEAAKRRDVLWMALGRQLTKLEASKV